MTQFKGKAIYNPSGKAAEYSRWACNFYTGCSNGCEYCYLKKGIGKAVLGGSTPTLKKCFRDEHHAIDVFFKELYDPATEQPKADIKEHGIFFTFSSDPCLPETQTLNMAVITSCLMLHVPVHILTKCTKWMDTEQGQQLLNDPNARDFLAVGFTLTGHDELEPNAAPNAERIAAMKRIHDAGIRTFASIEPVISTSASLYCIEKTLGCCDLYKIGLMSGKRDYDKEDMRMFVGRACFRINTAGAKVYWKESVRRFLGREITCAAEVDSDYNIFRENLK